MKNTDPDFKRLYNRLQRMHHRIRQRLKNGRTVRDSERMFIQKSPIQHATEIWNQMQEQQKTLRRKPLPIPKTRPKESPLIHDRDSPSTRTYLMSINQKRNEVILYEQKRPKPEPNVWTGAF